jgi:threonine/homoserine/homoserine lactone efflux protein
VDPVTDNIWVFFGMAIVISLSGVMMPGPVFAAAIAKGYEDQRAGIRIALGHGLVEFPLMALMILSLGYVFKDEMVKISIGLVGGGLLIFMGGSMLRSVFETRRAGMSQPEQMFPYGPFAAGAITTSANPYFFLWWATAGALLIITAQEFGAIVVVIFAGVHWSCDLGWYYLTTFTVFRTKHLWTPFVHSIVFGVCGALMMVFGVYFMIGPASELI